MLRVFVAPASRRLLVRCKKPPAGRRRHKERPSLTSRKPSGPRRLLSAATLAIIGIMSGRTIPFLLLLASMVNAASARADEIRLKDGTKISGTIVGFENDS